MTKLEGIISQHDPDKASYRSYVTGFIVSLVCTFSAYLLTANHILSKDWGLVAAIAALALVQALTQLILFLHLGKEAKPRFKLLVFGFMLTVILILVVGSIWVMHNLNGRMMSPSKINNYMKQQDDGGL